MDNEILAKFRARWTKFFSNHESEKAVLEALSDRDDKWNSTPEARDQFEAYHLQNNDPELKDPSDDIDDGMDCYCDAGCPIADGPEYVYVCKMHGGK